MVIKTELKILLEREGMTQKELFEKLGTDKFFQSFNRRINNGSYRVDEFDELLNHLGYELKIVKKEGEQK